MPPAAQQLTNRPAVLSLGLFLTVTAAFSLWTIGLIKDAVVHAVLHGGPSPLRAAIGSIGLVDVVLLILVVLSSLWIMRLEISQGAYSRFLTGATAYETLIVLTLFLAWTGHSYAFPGVLLAGDAATHISRFLEVQIGLQHGVLPTWTNYQYMGEPLLWFTGPLVYVAGGTLSFLLGDPTRAAKVLLFSLHMAAGYLFYAFLLRLERGRIAAMIGSICFSGCFAILHLFVYRGVFPQAFTIVFLVLLFFSADGLFRDRGRQWVNALAFSLATAGLIINHQPHALFAAAYLLIFTVAALANGWWSMRAVPLLLVAGVLGVITSTAAVLPTITEADWVMINAGEQPFGLHVPTFARLLHLILWKDIRTTWGFDYWAYLGLGLLIGLVAGLWAAFRGGADRSLRPVVITSSACALASLFLYNPVVRDILYMVFFVGIIAACGFDWILVRFRARQRVALALFALVLCDVMSTSIQPVARTDKAFLVSVGERLRDLGSSSRVVQIELAPGTPPAADMGPDNYASSFRVPVPRLAGDHNMAATHVHNFAATLIKQAETDLRSTQRLQPLTRDLMAAFNVGKIICNSPISNGCPDSFDPSVKDSELGRFVPISDATPVIFSRNLIRMSFGGGVEKPMLWDEDFYLKPPSVRVEHIRETLADWRKTEQFDLAHRQAAFIAVKDLPPDYVSPATDEAWRPTLESYHVGLQRTTFRFQSDIAGYAQLACPWYPGISVLVNGLKVRPLEGTLNFVVVRLPAGKTLIELRPELTGIERTSLFISLFGLIATFGNACWLAFRRKAPTRRIAST
jgi:hypothetical protein